MTEIERAIQNREACLKYLTKNRSRISSECLYAVKLSLEALREKAENDKLREEGRMAVLPYKIGDKVYAIVPADCESGMCPDTDMDSCLYSPYQLETKDIFNCRNRHSHVEEMVIESMILEVDEDSQRLCFNEWVYKAYKSREEAEKALK